MAAPRKEEEDHSAEHERYGPVPCVSGYFPNIPFRHPPSIGASFQPLVPPELRRYARGPVPGMLAVVRARNTEPDAAEPIEDVGEAPAGTRLTLL